MIVPIGRNWLHLSTVVIGNLHKIIVSSTGNAHEGEWMNVWVSQKARLGRCMVVMQANTSGGHGPNAQLLEGC